jgi:hypothetical protein
MRKSPMRNLVAGLLSVAFVAAPTATADAAKPSKRHGNHCDVYCQRYPSANSRQKLGELRRNAISLLPRH